MTLVFLWLNSFPVDEKDLGKSKHCNVELTIRITEGNKRLRDTFATY